jgi:hypothetical protein
MHMDFWESVIIRLLLAAKKEVAERGILFVK